MRASAVTTDRVRSVLLRKGLIRWGKESQVIVAQIARILQTMERDGVLLFKRAPDQLYTLVHCTDSYGAVLVNLKGFNDALLGSTGGRFRAKDAVRVQRRLSALGVSKPIIIK